MSIAYRNSFLATGRIVLRVRILIHVVVVAVIAWTVVLAGGSIGSVVLLSFTLSAIPPEKDRQQNGDQ